MPAPPTRPRPGRPVRAGTSCGLFDPSGGNSRPLPEDHDQCDYHDPEDRRCNWSAHCQPTLIEGLVEEIPDGRAERASEDESSPEQEYPADFCREVKNRERGQTRSEHQRTARIAEPGI